MSHIVQIQTRIRDATAVAAACRRLGLPEPVYGPVELYSGTETGWGVQMPGWRYPVVCRLDSGDVRFDNFGGRWGEQAQLDRFLQAYAVEKSLLEARRKGHTVREEQLTDGSIKLVVSVGGAA